jgi:ATP-dependent helicase/nuclease subunit A
VKDAIKAIKSLAKKALDAELITLKLGEADLALAELLPALRSAFGQVQQEIANAKTRRRGLTFADLEVHASRAVQSDEVRAYYA